MKSGFFTSGTKVSYKPFLPLIMLLLGVAAYANSFRGEFHFDDSRTIVTNPEIRQFRWNDVTGWLSRRGLVQRTFSLNYVTGGLNPADYHATNLLIHLAAGLLVYGLVRRTLQLSGMATRFRDHAAELAFFVASIWAVHPLATSAVTYVCQRYEALMGLFYLLALYSVNRAVAESRRIWFVAAVLACAAGMASKEVMITAPVVILAYDRIFLARSFREIGARRWFLYACLGATWGYLGWLMQATERTAVSFGRIHGGGSSVTYALTQAQVIVHYLRLSFWPYPLILDYGWPLIERVRDAVPSLILIGGLGVSTLRMLWRRPAAGFLGFCFFAVLSPTSSFMPRPDCAFEYRMYLPLVAVVAAAVLGGYDLWSRFRAKRAVNGTGRGSGTGLAVLGCLVLLAFAGMTHLRNRAYYSTQSMWNDIAARHPGNYRAQSAVISTLLHEGRYGEAETLARELMERCEKAKRTANTRRMVAARNAGLYYRTAHYQVGRALLCQRRAEESVAHFTAAVDGGSDDKHTLHNRALAFYIMGRNQEALQDMEASLAVDPWRESGHLLIADVLARLGRYAEASNHYGEALRLAPDSLYGKSEFAWFLATCPDDRLRDGYRALRLAMEVNTALGRRSFRALDVLAAAQAETGRFDDAARTAQQALALARSRAGDGDSNHRGGGEEIQVSPTPTAPESAIAGIEERIRLYKGGNAFREPVISSSP